MGKPRGYRLLQAADGVKPDQMPGFLQKPFCPDVLLQKVDQVFGSTRPG